MVEKITVERRSFIGPDEETEYFIGIPTAEGIRGADWQYSKIYTRCLNEGIPTSAEMTDILRRRGVIGKDFDKRAEELSITLRELIERLMVADDNSQKAEMAVDVARAREALFQWNQRLSGPMSNTCEQMADDARLEFLTASILQNEDGTKVWEDYNAFLTSQNQSLTLKARYEVMLFLQGYSSDFLERTPEAVAMREVEEDILAVATEAVRAEEKEKEDKKVAKEAKKVSKKPVKSSAKKPAKKPVKIPVKEKIELPNEIPNEELVNNITEK